MKEFDIYPAREMKRIDPYRDHIIISVNEVGADPYPINTNRNTKDVIRLHFDDLEEETLSFRMAIGRDARILTEEQADEILDFVERNSAISYIIVHCAAGVSRSPAIGAALSLIYNGRGEDQRFFDEFVPNRHVYRTILERALDRGIFKPHG